MLDRAADFDDDDEKRRQRRRVDNADDDTGVLVLRFEFARGV